MSETNINLTLSLDDYERTLLDEFVRIYEIRENQTNDDGEYSFMDNVFDHWLWRRKVIGNFKDLTEIPGLVDDMGGDMQLLWSTLMHFLHYYIYNFLYFRTLALQKDNPGFPQALIGANAKQISNIQFKPQPSDLRYWKILENLYDDNEAGVVDSTSLTLEELIKGMRPELRTQAEQGSDNDSLWEDESDGNDDQVKTEHQESSTQSATGDDEVHREEYGSLGIEEGDDASIKPDELRTTSQYPADEQSDLDDFYIPFEIWSLLRKSSILRRRKDNATPVFKCIDDHEFGKYYCKVSNHMFAADKNPELWLSGIRSQTTHLGLVGHLSRWGAQGNLVVEDPRQFIEFIPFTELKSIGNERTEGDPELVWYPETPITRFEHHLFTEEVVYRFCVQNNFLFPDHLHQNRVAFMTRYLDETDFVKSVQEFWQKWSDCAITMHPVSRKWILLETRPGRRFRYIWDTRDRLSALRHFRRLVDDARYGARTSLRETLGLNFQPKYADLLEALPFSHFQILPDRPMHGSRGVVYHAVWTYHSIEQSKPKNTRVVLKAIANKVEDDVGQIMKELDTTFTALQGFTLRTVQFIGITKAPETIPKECPLPSELRNSFFLVSEYAFEGSALDCIKRVFTGSLQDWDLILRFVGDIATGLKTIHSRGVIHRDLHWGNVLATTKRHEEDLLPQIQKGRVNDDEKGSIELLIADLGEGKVLTEEASSGRQYGNAEFRAPEIRSYGSSKCSAASDMYSLGRLADDLVTEYWRAADRRGEHVHFISRTLQEIIEALRKANPRKRPSADEVSKRIQDVWKKGLSDGWGFRPENIDLVEHKEQNSSDEVLENDNDNEIPF